MWRTGLDIFFHLLLPTISLLTISFAGYTRYARAGMVEVLGQDYVRTARAKGMPERVVIVRHAFRNVLIPITTLVATDLGALLGGAIITEYMFAIREWAPCSNPRSAAVTSIPSWATSS